MSNPQIHAAIALASLFLTGSPVAQTSKSVFASKVIASNNNGKLGGGIFANKNVLGGPLGAGIGSGSSHVLSLGNGGSLTLGFDVTITDGPGADFVVFENPFLFGSSNRTFAELAFVEVSSNGKDFVRFPTSFVGVATTKGNFTTSPVVEMRGFAGVTPVYADVTSKTAPDPLDVASAGGDAFDLAQLVGEPLVKSGKVKLSAITQIRLVDVVSGKSKAGNGKTIYDDGSGSADIDAVAVIHHTGNQSKNAPRVQMVLPANGQLAITLSDPNGLTDLDVASVRVLLNSRPVPFGVVLPFFFPTASSATSVTFTLIAAPPKSFRFRFALSLKDKSGSRSGASVVRH